MANIVFAWQLGGGMGHLMQMLPLARELAREHQVYLISKNIPRAVSIFKDVGVRFLQAPVKPPGRYAFRKALSTAHMLGNTGFGDRHELFGLASAWRNLFRLVRADLTFFDHSPVGLLAARGLPVRRVLIGTGFFCPPHVQPLPITRSARHIARTNPIDPSQIAADEELVLDNVNWLLAQWRQAPLKQLSELYSEADECFLTTFRELDHFTNRPGNPKYWGPINATGGARPDWPSGSGKRVFAYLKPFPGLETLLSLLRDGGNPALLYVSGIKSASRDQYESSNLRFVTERLDPGLIARECDVGILNGTHGSACDLLLAGKPTLQIPIYAEQDMLAEKIARLGAAETVRATSDEADLSVGLRRVFDDDRFRRAAAAFAEKYRCFDSVTQQVQMVERARELIPRRAQVSSQPDTPAPWMGIPAPVQDPPMQTASHLRQP